MFANPNLSKEDLIFLVNLLMSNELTEIEVDSGAVKVVMKKKCEQQIISQTVTGSAGGAGGTGGAGGSGGSGGVTEMVHAPVESVVTPSETAPKKGNIINAPIVGTFYSAPTPDSPPFVKVGDKIKKGDVIFIIESMKIMNEVVSIFDGTVKGIFVKNGEAVEFGQDLIEIE